MFLHHVWFHNRRYFIKTFKLIFMFFLGVFRKQNVFVAEAAKLPILPHFLTSSPNAAPFRKRRHVKGLYSTFT